MRRKTQPFSKFTLSICIAIFSLSFFNLNGEGKFLKPGIAEAENFRKALGFTKKHPAIQAAIKAKSRHSHRLMSIPGVVGHGVGVSVDGRPTIKIFVTKPGILEIPAALNDIPTKVEVTGMVFAYADPTARYHEPVPIGVSTGNPDITAGTIGCKVTGPDIDGDGIPEVYALSNNHVYANKNVANLGDIVIQPGTNDGGQNPVDAIGELWDFESIDFSGGNNTIDAAIARSLPEYRSLDTSTPPQDQNGKAGYGTPKSTTVSAAELALGQTVMKFGRTTGQTYGKIVATDVTVDVCYESFWIWCTQSARFVHQIAIAPGDFSTGGDSGSLIVTYDKDDDENNKKSVGLLFAGSDSHTFANRIDLVLDYFDVTIAGDDPTPDDPPVTDFAAHPTNGPAPLTVQFTDQSDGNPTTWIWDFGDAVGESTEQNPSHTYTDPGTYTVTLTTENAYGSDTQEMAAYITVTEPSAWEVITYDDFESGWGNYTDGGGDCRLYTGGTFAHQGNAAANIQDNSGAAASFYHTDDQDVSIYSQLEIEFWFIAVSMDNNNEDFWVQYHDGSQWQTLATFAQGTDFNNGSFYNKVVSISNSTYNFPTNARLRFMCDASGIRDDVYIDEVVFRGR